MNIGDFNWCLSTDALEKIVAKNKIKLVPVLLITAHINKTAILSG